MESVYCICYGVTERFDCHNALTVRSESDGQISSRLDLSRVDNSLQILQEMYNSILIRFKFLAILFLIQEIRDLVKNRDTHHDDVQIYF